MCYWAQLRPKNQTKDMAQVGQMNHSCVDQVNMAFNDQELSKDDLRDYIKVQNQIFIPQSTHAISRFFYNFLSTLKPKGNHLLGQDHLFASIGKCLIL